MAAGLKAFLKLSVRRSIAIDCYYGQCSKRISPSSLSYLALARCSSSTSPAPVDPAEKDEDKKENAAPPPPPSPSSTPPPFPSPESSSTALAPLFPARLRGAQVIRTDHKALVAIMTEVYQKGDPKGALKIFDDWLRSIDPETRKLNRPQVSTWNIALYCKFKSGDCSLQDLFGHVQRMGNLGLSPNKNTFLILFRAAAYYKNLQAMDFLFEKLEEHNITVQAEMCELAIDACLTERKVQSAMKYVDIMVDKNLKPEEKILSGLIQVWSRMGKSKEAYDITRWCYKMKSSLNTIALGDLLTSCLEADNADGVLFCFQCLMEKFQVRSNASFNMDEGTLTEVLSLAARTGNTDLSKLAWHFLCRSLPSSKSPSPACFLARVHAGVAAGDFQYSLKAIQEMEIAYEKDIDSMLFSPFSCMRPFVLGCARGGVSSLDAAYFKLEELKGTANVPLSAINCVVLGCSNTWDLDRAYQTFESIEGVFGLKPNVHSYNALLDGFGKGKKTAEAVMAYNTMVESGVQPDYRSLCLLINAHLVNHDVAAAMEVVSQLLELGYKLDKDTAQKIYRRSVRECNNDAVQQMLNLAKELKYKNQFAGIGRQAFLFQG